MPFQVNPLDVNIAKIQYNLLNRLEREVPENGDFTPIIESFNSKDPTIALGSIKVTCKHLKDDSLKQNSRILSVTCCDKSSANNKTMKLFTGDKKEILEYLNKTDFFEECKKLALSLN